MPRTARASAAGYSYHVLNRGNARAQVFHKEGDYEAFLDAISEAGLRVPMRLLGYCLMPNHFHLVLWPRGDGDLSRWMHWLLTTHVRRYIAHYHSSGHVWQGRFKAFPIEEDPHLLTVLRYVERNALRANLVARAEQWRWCSLWRRATRKPPEGPALSPWPIERPSGWTRRVNAALSPAEEEAIRRAIQRGQPFGDMAWQVKTAQRLGLLSTLRPIGRPRASLVGDS